MLEGFTIETFASRVGEPFTVADEQDERVELTLAECERLSGDGYQRVPFSLVFVGPAERVLPQHTYHVEHAELGAFPLFIVPIGRDPDGARYEVIFN